MNTIRLHQCLAALTDQAGDHSAMGAIVFVATLIGLTGIAIFLGKYPPH